VNSLPTPRERQFLRAVAAVNPLSRRRGEECWWSANDLRMTALFPDFQFARNLSLGALGRSCTLKGMTTTRRIGGSHGWAEFRITSYGRGLVADSCIGGGLNWQIRAGVPTCPACLTTAPELAMSLLKGTVPAEIPAHSLPDYLPATPEQETIRAIALDACPDCGEARPGPAHPARPCSHVFHHTGDGVILIRGPAAPVLDHLPGNGQNMRSITATDNQALGEKGLPMTGIQEAQDTTAVTVRRLITTAARIASPEMASATVYMMASLIAEAAGLDGLTVRSELCAAIRAAARPAPHSAVPLDGSLRNRGDRNMGERTPHPADYPLTALCQTCSEDTYLATPGATWVHRDAILNTLRPRITARLLLPGARLRGLTTAALADMLVEPPSVVRAALSELRDGTLLTAQASPDGTRWFLIAGGTADGLHQDATVVLPDTGSDTGTLAGAETIKRLA
jgi:hypothetical protein